MKKLMLIYYNIVAVLTILYLALTVYLMNYGNPFITSQGWARCDSWCTHPSDFIWDGSCEEEVPR